MAPAGEEWGAALLEYASALFTADDRAAPAGGQAGEGGGGGEAEVRLADLAVDVSRAQRDRRASRALVSHVEWLASELRKLPPSEAAPLRKKLGAPSGVVLWTQPRVPGCDSSVVDG